MYSYILNISVFSGTKITYDKEFYHYFCSDIVCVYMCVCVCVWSCRVSKTEISWCIKIVCRFQLPRGLRRGFAAVLLLGVWVRIPPGTWIFVCCVCYV